MDESAQNTKVAQGNPSSLVRIVAKLLRFFKNIFIIGLPQEFRSWGNIIPRTYIGFLIKL